MFGEKSFHPFHLFVWRIVETAMYSVWNCSMLPSIQIPSGGLDRFLDDSGIILLIKFQQYYLPYPFTEPFQRQVN